MPRISISDLTDAEKVEEAMAEHDRAPEAFLARRRFGKARDYFLVYEGRRYPSKAIAGRAYELQHGVDVYSNDFSGGEETVATVLEGLGFEVTRPESRSWDADEMTLAVHWYLRNRPEALHADHPAVRDLSRILELRARGKGRARAAGARGPADVARQLAGFGLLDPESPSFGQGAPSRAHRDAWARASQAGYALKRKVDEILGALDRAETTTRADVARRLAASWGVEEAPGGGYQLRTRSEPGEESEAVTTPDALLADYAGPRAVARRTPAQPRIEDPEPFDRANDVHEELRDALVAFLRSRGFAVHDPTDVAEQLNLEFDLAASHADLRLVIEVKSMPDDVHAEAARLRSGLGQVLWYRHRFFAVCREQRVAVLAVARQPRSYEDWVATCRGANVVLTWPEQFAWLVEACRRARAR